jgi:hypothetical protein
LVLDFQRRQIQIDPDLVGYFQTEIDGITAGFIGVLITERHEVRHVAKDDRLTGTDALQRVAMGHYR